jgi:predicted RNA-binding protein associated with RNAse of E/G family
MDGDDWICTDLFLDHWIPAPGGHVMWLDEDELAAARDQGLVSDDQLLRIGDERATVDRLTAAAEWPPPVTREMTLTRALELLQA